MFRVGGSLKKEKEIAAKTVMMLKKEQIRNMEMASEVFHLKQLLADLRSELKGLAEVKLVIIFIVHLLSVPFRTIETVHSHRRRI